MRTPEKWINVDESFEKKISVTVPDNHTECQNLLSTTKKQSRHLKSWKCKAFVGFAGADDLDKTRSPEIGIVAEGLVQYASDFGNQFQSMKYREINGDDGFRPQR